MQASPHLSFHIHYHTNFTLQLTSPATVYLIEIPKRKLGSHFKKCRCAIIGATSSHTPPRATVPSYQRLGFVTYLMSTSVVDLECFRAGDERFCKDVLCCRLVDSEEEVVDVCLLIILTADNPNSALLVSYRLYNT